MKMTRKLIPAFVMLIVSAIMLSTASYAWLAESTSVSAGPMTVTANTDVVFMQISNEEDGTFGRSATAKNSSAENLNLVTAKLDNSEHKLAISEQKVIWQTGNGKNPDDYTVDDSGLTDVAQGDVNKYVLANTFYIKMSNASSTLSNLKLSGVSLADGDAIDANSFDESLRVLAVAMQCGEIVGVQCWDLCAGTDLKKDSANVFGNKLADTVNGTNVTTVDVYIYYDGNDEYVFTDNLNTSASTGRVITVSFSAEKTQP